MDFIETIEEELAREFEEEEIKNNSLDSPMNEVQREKSTFYIKCVFSFYTLLWILIIIFNKLFENPAFFILIIPFALFITGFMNAYDIADDEVEQDVFSTTFITGGLIIFMALMTLFNKDKHDRFLSHILYLAVIFTLLSYYHIWVDKINRHICKISRSCLEVIAITLYVYALTVYFMEFA